MTDRAELRRLAEAVLLIEKESAKWAAGIPDSQEREAVEHGVRLATAIIQFRDAARNPKDVLSFLDRLDAAEKVCEAARTYIKYGNSPVCIGWDEMLDALSKWQGVK